jgi:hypothetical protein
MSTCPNCKREFDTNVKGAYCEECWRAWCRDDASFERRFVQLIYRAAPPQSPAKEG